jgi:hypothetical protein
LKYSKSVIKCRCTFSHVYIEATLDFHFI